MPPPRVLVFQHAPFCPLETFGEFLHGDGIDPVIVQLDQGEKIPQLELFDTLIVLGGPMDVWETGAHPWLIPEKAAIGRWVKTLDRPMLGICLGHQLLAEALGGEVGYAKKPEADLTEVIITDRGKSHPLMAGFGSSKAAINFHGCEVTRLPDDAVCLASTADCALGAFAAGTSSFGIQYHAEATDVLVDEWMEQDSARALVEKLHGLNGVKHVSTRVARAMPELKDNARRLYRNFMDIARAAHRD
jgi:GMP synthase-like glutamine amidotransferase